MNAPQKYSWFYVPIKRIAALAASASIVTLLAGDVQSYDADRWKVRQSRMVLRKATIPFEGKTTEIEVYTEPEHQGWGRQVADWATKLIPAYYAKFGSLDSDVIRIIEEPQLPSAGWNAQSDGIRIRYPAGPEILAEQFAHYWIYPRTVEPAWLQKGLAGWISLRALRDAKFSLEAANAWQQRVVTVRSGASALDKPLSGSDLYKMTQQQYQFTVAKAILWVQIVEYVLGVRAFDGWIINVAEDKSAIDEGDVKKILDQENKESTAVFSGWIESGAYQKYDWSTFDDKDQDGFADGLETLVGADPTKSDSDNDGLADGFEYWSGLSAVDRDSNGDGRFDAPMDFVAVDGLASEWNKLPQASSYNDAQGDGGEFDLGQISVLASEKKIYVAVQPVSPVNQAVTYWITYQFDFDQNKKPDLVIIADEQGKVWQSRIRLGQQVPTSGSPASGLVVHHGSVSELAIPIELFEGNRNLTMNVRVDRPGAVSPIDHTGGYWHKIATGG